MAVVICRGPSKETAVLGWDRRTDSFTLGQWLRGRIYSFRCDISPDGRHWIYFAMKGTRTWTVLAKTPYLKALDFFEKDSAYEGGGLFESNTTYWLNDRYYSYTPQEQRTSGLKAKTGKSPYPRVIENNECPGIYVVRLKRDGWKVDSREKGVWNFTKSLNMAWILVKRFCMTMPRHVPGRGCHSEEYALVNTATGEMAPCKNWEWADVDGNRLVWAEKGFIRCAHMTEEGLGETQDLLDCNTLAFEAREAPY